MRLANQGRIYFLTFMIVFSGILPVVGLATVIARLVHEANVEYGTGLHNLSVTTSHFLAWLGSVSAFYRCYPGMWLNPKLGSRWSVKIRSVQEQ